MDGGTNIPPASLIISYTGSLTAASFYVVAAVKFPDIKNTSPAGLLPAMVIRLFTRAETSAPRLIPAYNFAGSFLERRAPMRLERASIRAGTLTSHPMPSSLFSDLGSSSVSAPSERRFFLWNPLAARATHTNLAIYQSVLAQFDQQTNPGLSTAPSGIAPVSR
jgi:hypothetical protein